MDNLFQQSEKTYTVLELNTAVKNLIRNEFPDHVWVCGEIQDLRDRGVINLNLVQKHQKFDEITAQAKAVIFENIKPLIMRRLKEADETFELKKDIEVKLLCRVDLYAKTGQFSLTVVDIDPYFTLGKIAASRQKIIEELKVKGLLEKNKSLFFPEVPLNIGLVTSYDSAAFHDFVHELEQSGFGFKVSVWDSYVQGKQTETDVTVALNYFGGRPAGEIDVVVISRGGGSTADLSWFDNKQIAEAIASCPIPVITALGHQINVTVCDIVSHTSVKTPTKAAQFLIDKVSDFKTAITQLSGTVIAASDDILAGSRSKLAGAASRIESLSQRFFRFHQQNLAEQRVGIFRAAEEMVKTRKEKIKEQSFLLRDSLKKLFKNLENEVKYITDKVSLLNPRNVLKRGYSLTLKREKTVRSLNDLERGDIIKTILYEGSVISQVKEKNE